MQNTFKLSLPSLITLLIGMSLFVLLSAIAPAISVPPNLLKYVYSAIVIGALYLLSRSFLHFEKIPASSVNLVPDKNTLSHLFFGLVIGAVITGLMLLVLFSLTDLSVERFESQTLMPFLIASVVFVPLAFMEELLFRGYPFFRLAQVINIRWIILITAILFGLYHYNESATLSSVLLGPGIWGVTYGVIAYATNSIAAPLGVHVSVNAMQAYFGMKNYFPPMWEITMADVPSMAGINPDTLGIIMQFSLLIVSVIALEVVIKKKAKASSR